MHKRTIMVVLGAAGLAVTSAVVGAQFASGATTADETVFIPIDPCRLVDTRVATNVGPVATPIGQGQDVTFTAWGTGDADSPCNIPNTATAIATNTTAANPTARTFITLYPADVPNPGTSNLNVLAGSTPTPNSANIPLSDTGQFNVFNNLGTVNVIIDINGYYQPSTNIGEQGPQGPPGPAGPQGLSGDADVGHSISVADARDVAFADTSVAIGTNGNPIVSYLEDGTGDLSVAVCNDPTCTTATIAPVDTTGGTNSSIAIGIDGNPVISYRHGTSGQLNVAACTDLTCTAPAVITPFEDAGANVIHTSIAIGTDGNPVVSYLRNASGELKVAACTNPTCTAATITPLDVIGSASGIDSDTAITIGGNGNPIVSSHDNFANDLLVAACTNPTCTAPATITPFDTDDFIAFGLSVTTGTDGNAIVSYYNTDTGALKVAACTNPTCTAATITELDNSSVVGFYSSITIGTDGNPVISYFDNGTQDLKVAACTDATCTAASVTALDTIGDVGRFSSIVIGVDGNPVVSYRAAGSADLKVAVCGNTTCAPYPGTNR